MAKPQVNVADAEVADPPTDSISCLSFSGMGDYLAVASWDSNVGRINDRRRSALFDHPIL